MSLDLKPLQIGLLVGGAAEVRGTPVTKSQTHDRARFEAAFRDHFDRLWRLAARLGVPLASVDDVVQEAFITAERRMPEIAPGSERRFLVGVLVKLSANVRRRQHTRSERLALLAHEMEPAADAEALLAKRQLRELLDLALDALPHEQRVVLVLHELEDLGTAEIGELLGIARGTVASRLKRARGRFSKIAARLRAQWPGLGE